MFESPDSRQILSSMCSLQLPESWHEACTTFCELGIAGLFNHPFKEVTAFLSAEGLGVSTPVPRGVRHRWPLSPQGQLFKFVPEPLLFGTFRGNCPPI